MDYEESRLAYKAYLSSMGVTAEKIRDNKKDREPSCAHCSVKRVDRWEDAVAPLPFKKCSKCKSIWYCSRECQKKHWPEHKLSCADQERSISKLVLNFLANPFLPHLLEMCICADRDMHFRDDAATTMFAAHIDVGIEPCDVDTFHRILEGKVDPRKKVPGMLQILSVDYPPLNTVNDSMKAMWARAKNQLFAANAHYPIVVLDFSYHGSAMRFETCVYIGPESMKAVEKNITLDRFSRARGFERDLKMTHDNLISSINAAVRADAENDFKLRRMADLDDLRVIAKLGKGKIGKNELILGKKIAADPVIYAHMPEEKLRKKAITAEPVSCLEEEEVQEEEVAANQVICSGPKKVIEDVHEKAADADPAINSPPSEEKPYMRVIKYQLDELD